MSSNLLYQRDKPRIIAAFISVLVAISAFLLRAPSCYESFWLDELHSAWCIWDGFSDVEPRASAGHQTPLFYWVLWIWKQLFGDSEFALRMISVAAVSAASGLASYVIATRFRSIAAGFTAGMVLAMEENSIFFGTELRPYAVIILLSTIVVLGYLRLLSSEDLRQQKSARMAMFISAFAAVSIQVTSAAIVLIFVFLSQFQKKRITPTRREIPSFEKMAWLRIELYHPWRRGDNECGNRRFVATTRIYGRASAPLNRLLKSEAFGSGTGYWVSPPPSASSRWLRRGLSIHGVINHRSFGQSSLCL